MPFVADLWESNVPKGAGFHRSILGASVQEYPILWGLSHPGTQQSRNPLRGTHTPPPSRLVQASP